VSISEGRLRRKRIAKIGAQKAKKRCATKLTTDPIGPAEDRKISGEMTTENQKKNPCKRTKRQYRLAQHGLTQKKEEGRCQLAKEKG